MGFQRLVLPKRNEKAVPKEYRQKIELVGCELIEEAIHAIVH
jgi:predicted ATP-dependent protease